MDRVCGPAISDAGERTAGLCRLRAQGILTLWLSVLQVNPVERIGESHDCVWKPLTRPSAGNEASQSVSMHQKKPAEIYRRA